MKKKINPRTRLCCWIRFEFFFVARLRQTATSCLVKDGQHHHRHLQRSLHPLHSLNTNLGSFTSLSNLKGRTKKANATSQWRDHQNWDKVFIIHFTASMIFFLKRPRCWSGRGLKPRACSADWRSFNCPSQAVCGNWTHLHSAHRQSLSAIWPPAINSFKCNTFFQSLYFENTKWKIDQVVQSFLWPFAVNVMFTCGDASVVGNVYVSVKRPDKFICQT